MDSGTVGFKGLGDRALEFPSGVTPGLAVAIAPANRARLRYNDISKTLQVSLDSGAYADLGIGGASPWVEMGGVVRLQNVTNEVVIGAAVMAGSEKLRVVGDVRVDSSVLVNRVTTAPASGVNLELLADTDMVTVGTGAEPTDLAVEGKGFFEVDDNDAVSFRIRGRGTLNEYVVVDTTTGSEEVTTSSPQGGLLLISTGIRVESADDDPSAFEMAQGANSYLAISTSNAAESFRAGGNANLTASILLDQGGVTATIPDNIADSFKIEEGGNVYLGVDTSNGGELVSIGNAVTNPDITVVGSGDVSLGSGPLCLPERPGDPGAVADSVKLYAKDAAGTSQLFARSDDGTVHQITPNVGSAPGGADTNVQYNSAGAFGGSANFTFDGSALAFAGTDIDLDPTGDVTLDMDATRTIIIQIADNVSEGVRISQGSFDYLAIDTSDGFEAVRIGHSFGSGNIGTRVAINIGDNIAQAFEVQEGTEEYIVVDTTNGSEEIRFGNATTNPTYDFLGTGTAAFGGAVTIAGKLTVTGAIDPPSVLLSGGTALFFESNDGSTAPVSGGATGRLRYNDSTGTWQASTQGGAYADLGFSLSGQKNFLIPDNTADAFTVKEGTNNYWTCTTTNGASLMTWGNSGGGGDPNTMTFFMTSGQSGAWQVQGQNGVYFGCNTIGGNSIEFGNATDNPQFRFQGDGPIIVGSSAGDNSYIQIEDRSGDPAAVAGRGNLYTKDVSAVTELFYRDDTGAVVQLTSGGSVTAAAAFTIADNNATAYRITNATGGAQWLNMDTQNGAETITFGNVAVVAGQPERFRFYAPGDSLHFGVVNSTTGRQMLNVDTAFNQVTIGNITDASQLRIAGDSFIHVGSQSGDNAYIQIRERAGDPAHVAHNGNLYSKDVSGITELFWSDSDGTVTQQVVQLTNNGSVNATAPTDFTITDNTTNAYRIRNATGSAQWLNMDTQNAAEVMTFGNTTTVAGQPTQFTFYGPGNSGALGVVNSTTGRFAFGIDTSFDIITFGNSTDSFDLRLAGDGFLFLGSGASDNSYMQIRERTGDPAHVAHTGQLYAKDVSGITELFWADSNGIATQQIVQLTSNGALSQPTDIIIPDATTNAFRVRESGSGTPWIQVDTSGDDVKIGRNSGSSTVQFYVSDNNNAFKVTAVDGAGDWLHLALTGTGAFLVGNGTTLNPRVEFQVVDGNDNAFLVEQGNDDYIRVQTTNASEQVALGNAATNPDLNVLGTGAISLGASGATVGFYGTTPVAQSTGWSTTNVTTTKALDADSTTLDEVADVVGSIIDYLLTRGDFAA